MFSTLITQWGIFSDRYDSLDDFENGSAVLIPDDPSNGARALYILEAAGLIELADDAGLFPTVDDIVDNPKNLEIREVQALSIRQLYNDPAITAAVVGLSYFDPAQGVTAESALYLDDPNAESNLPYVNVVAVNSDNVDNPAWKILEEAYADPRIEAALEKEYQGSIVLVKVPLDELRDRLSQLEDAARAAN